MATSATDGAVSTTTSRPIERLPVRRLSNESKEAMNCKSCRKRKIKCNRLKPSCEACQVFKVECIYDAVPKKRGPKTDVLEALLKRVNGLEKRLKDENKPITPPDAAEASAVIEATESVAAANAASAESSESSSHSQDPVTQGAPRAAPKQKHTKQASTNLVDATLDSEHLRPKVEQISDIPNRSKNTSQQYNYPALDIYFGRLHGKPYHILDETATRQRWQAGQLPATIVNGIYAVTARHVQHLVGGYNAAVRLSDESATRARLALDSDDPTIENLQASLLLAMAFFQAGKGKKSYMLLSSAVSMALALGLHRELPSNLRISPAEREGRRKLFWTCYLMDRFNATGSKRPALIPDESIGLRLPAWPTEGSAVPYEGSFFSNGNSMPLTVGPNGTVGQSTGATLAEITRILGITNRYLAAGGVKGDSHFPWHAQSNLSRIRQDLDIWAGHNQDAFMSAEVLFAQQEKIAIVLAKIIYHLVHCLIYRPFLPVDLQELAETGQYQSWQIEATNLCFIHANAIAELIEVGKVSPTATDWPAFVGYCACTAGTIHVHGAHYVGREGDIFARSAEFLSREMTHLLEMRTYYAGVQRQREVLQMVYGCHSQLVKSLASSPMRFSPVFQMEDFFDRYPGQYIDGAHITFSDVTVESAHESLPAYDGLQGNGRQWSNQNQAAPTAMMPPPPRTVLGSGDGRPKKKRRRTNDASISTINTSSLAALNTLNTTLSPPSAPTSAIDSAVTQGQGLQAAANPSNTTLQRHHSVPTPSGSSDPSSDPQLYSQNPFSPNFSLSPWQMSLNDNPQAIYGGTLAQDHFPYDTYNGNSFSFGPPVDHQTPGGLSANGSALSESDKDPFLNLLEQLAENEHSQAGGPSDLDFFLSGQS